MQPTGNDLFEQWYQLEGDRVIVSIRNPVPGMALSSIQEGVQITSAAQCGLSHEWNHRVVVGNAVAT